MTKFSSISLETFRGPLAPATPDGMAELEMSGLTGRRDFGPGFLLDNYNENKIDFNYLNEITCVCTSVEWSELTNPTNPPPSKTSNC